MSECGKNGEEQQKPKFVEKINELLKERGLCRVAVDFAPEQDTEPDFIIKIDDEIIAYLEAEFPRRERWSEEAEEWPWAKSTD